MKMEEYTESANFCLKHREKNWQLQGNKKPAIWIVNMATSGSNRAKEITWILLGNKLTAQEKHSISMQTI